MDNWIVFGAGSGVGLELVKKLRASGKSVYALIRSEKYMDNLQEMGVVVVQGDVMSIDDVRNIFLESKKEYSDSRPIVVSTIGGRPKEGEERSDYKGNLNIIDLAKEFQTERMVLVTSIGCGDMRKNMSESAIRAFGSALLSKTKAEDYLIAQNIPYTIVRPGGLVSKPATGKAELMEGNDIHGMVTREDVADSIVRVLADEKTLGKILCVVDPSGEVQKPEKNESS